MQPKTKILVISLSLIFLLSICGWFFGRYELRFRSPITIAIHAPMTLVRRVLAYNITVVKSDANNSPLNPIQQYICNKFGDQCKTALAIAKAESNYNCNEINVNKNGTVDFSIFMENSIHLNKQFTLADLADCKLMVDRAYDLYKVQGWTPWSSYQSGAYKKFLY